MFGNDLDNDVRSGHWAKLRASRRFRIARWGAALPIIAVVASLRIAGPAQAEDKVVSTIEAPAPVPAESRWSLGDARALLNAIDDSAKEGLNPADYAPEALRAAIEAHQKGPVLDALALASAQRLAHDYANGRITDKAGLNWHMPEPMDATALNAGLNKAIDDKKVGTWLVSLLPDNDQYRALRAALAGAGDETTRDRLKINMERWRWMPRNLGDHYLYVNIPTYELAVMDGGREVDRYNVVVGAPDTPTPQLALYAQSVVVNPSWTLPPSVLKEGKVRPGAAAARKGYSFSRRADGSTQIRQAPGPQNALGRIKFDMPNPYAIYLHDTPNKAAFAKTSRALSHGCVRVQNIAQLAESLHDGDAIDSALADGTTKTLQFEKSVPVYIVYFTAHAESDGTIHYLADPYGRDDLVTAQMNRSVQMASR